jgi:rSAM/selenodomain-associated transferase 1
MGLGAAVSIVCKTPGVGGGKSRLQPLLGAGFAQQLSACFIRDVAAALEAVPEALGRQLYALFSPAGSEALLGVLLPSPWMLVPRQGASVGTVLQASTAAFLADGHDCAIMVNGDSPTLPTKLVEEAIAALREPGDRVVLGPALDGGYYLVGLKCPHPRLFEEIPWSTSEVLACTLRRAEEIGVHVVLLQSWYDVDEPQDFLRLQAELSGQAPRMCAGVTSGPAHHTRALVAAWAQSVAP